MSFLIKAGGTLYEGQANAAAANYNAGINEFNADATRQQGVAAVDALSRDQARKIGAMVAAYGASGVQSDSGSPMDVLADSARMAELDRLTMKYNYDLKAQGYAMQAELDRMQAKAAKTSSYFKATGQIMDGASSAMGGGTPIPSFGA